MFSSPFIEERLYLAVDDELYETTLSVLVPFYRGAVVFNAKYCSMCGNKLFSSPFIEERLYLRTTT